MSWLTDRLQALMTERGKNTDAMARELGIERSRLTNILSGAAVPNENLVKRFARHFGESAEEWLDRTGISTSAAAGPKTLPADFFRVARRDEITDGEMKVVFDGLVVVANVAGEYFAFGNICPHAFGPIGEGFLEDHVVECPWHAGQWDVRTGKMLTALATADVPTFEVRLQGDDIEIRVTERVLGQGTLAASPNL